MEQSFDAIVVGGGSAGLSFARTAADLGASVALIEPGPIGGTCVNRGCVPKKLLWDAAWRHVRRGLLPGASPPPPDFGPLQAAIGTKLRAIHASYEEDLARRGVLRLSAAATVHRDGSVEVSGERLRSDRVILACGARPTALDIPGAELALTSDDLLCWTTLPSSAVFLGAGYIGCELAGILAALGVEVSLVDPSDRILDGFDPDLAGAALDILRERGLTVHLGATPARITDENGARRVHFDDGGSIAAECIVNATGRSPNVDRLGPISSKLETAKSGAVVVDETFRTALPGVHAIGDAADRLPLTPVATRDGETLAQQLFAADPPAPIDLAFVATAAFVMPPVAQVGDPDRGRAAGGQDLAQTALAPEQHWSTRTLKKIAPGGTDICGVALMSDAAAEMIAPFAALVAGGRVAATGVHPTFGEDLISGED
ncbi:dihydrolipoyl dehydrogenase family protein [Histidinibacterium lentulum]|uniref:NAD(P)/FAD-dependent oxidoreductase n=1 Tax=Histidinibacterium lentulum TaxID=2480588 RepID=A0A3N2R662_9RHOB|nr:FAD-dependent oxidoreductase [Histidinibacterium lentulum]ROU02888.1 NAD(P)/FAD-dependent oxidoreductase [Histidinibacterium lentulum]